jgi:hypothetical protein
MLVAISDRGNGKTVNEIFSGYDPSLTLLTLGKGTANSKILNYFGLGQTEKTILFSVLATGEARDILSRLEQALEMKKPGHGIGFMVPLQKGEHKLEYELIIAVSNRGYDEDVMDAARAAGASGGTIINARGLSGPDADKFFGVTIHAEKEIIMILAKSAIARGIMTAISEKAGAATQAGAVTFSVPVSDVEGLQPPMPSLDSGSPLDRSSE